MKKHLVIYLISVPLFLLLAISASAQFGIGRLKNEVNRFENNASRAANNQEKRLANIKNRADRMIANRIGQLNRLSARIGSDSSLSADEKSSLFSNIQTDINGLTSLKAKIDADTNIQTAKTDAREIITGYFIYKLFIPKIRLLIIIDNMQALASDLQGFTPQIQNLINTLNSSGKNVSQAQLSLNDINSQLQTINNSLAGDKTLLENLTTSGDPTTSFVKIRQNLATVRADFAKIRHDIGQLRLDFMQAIRERNTSSSSASLSPTP